MYRCCHSSQPFVEGAKLGRMDQMRREWEACTCRTKEGTSGGVVQAAFDPPMTVAIRVVLQL